MEVNKEYLRREGESEFEHKLRLCNAKLNKELDLDWSEIVEILGLSISSDHLRKLSYAYKEFGEYLGDKKIEDISDDDVIAEIILKKQELEKEKVRYQDQKREYKAYLRQDARFEHLKDILVSEIKSLNNIKPMLSDFTCAYDYTSEREASLLLSDWHIGLEVPKSYWNEYNKEILKSRVNRLKNKVIGYCKENRVHTLNVEMLGDLINGYIHVSTRIFNEEDVISQTMSCSEILAELITDLSSYIPEINVYNSVGNHARCFADIKQSLDKENFEYLVEWYLKSRLSNLSNVHFIENKIDDEIIVYQTFNETIFSVHGHKDNVNTVVDDLTKMLRIIPTRVHLGHYHKHYEKEDGGINVVVNGSLSGVDQYAVSKRLVGIPHQKLIIFDQFEGELCTYKIKFQ